MTILNLRMILKLNCHFLHNIYLCTATQAKIEKPAGCGDFLFYCLTAKFAQDLYVPSEIAIHLTKACTNPLHYA